MPPRNPKPARKTKKTNQKLATKAKKSTGKIKAQRIAATGLDTRIRGHVSARGKRNQARKDSR